MAQGNVEVWLGILLKAALSSLHVVIKNASVAISDPNFELINFFNSFPAQVCHLHFFIVHKMTHTYKHTCIHTYIIHAYIHT